MSTRQRVFALGISWAKHFVFCLNYRPLSRGAIVSVPFSNSIMFLFLFSVSFVRDNITTYSNIYCYMCNQPSLFKVKPIECSEPLDTFWSEFGASPVYDLLTEEPTVLWRVMNEQNGAICPNGTFLDPVSVNPHAVCLVSSIKASLFASFFLNSFHYFS